MGIVTNWISANYSLVALILVVIFVVGLIVFIVVIHRLNKLAKQYKTLMRGIEGKNIEEIVVKNTKTLELVLQNIRLFEDKIKSSEKIIDQSINKVGLLRFNAFRDTGGDLSFALALLNKKGDGVVISSIFGRDDARTYAKPVKDCVSTYHLSSEEEKAIQLAFQADKL